MFVQKGVSIFFLGLSKVYFVRLLWNECFGSSRSQIEAGPLNSWKINCMFFFLPAETLQAWPCHSGSSSLVGLPNILLPSVQLILFLLALFLVKTIQVAMIRGSKSPQIKGRVYVKGLTGSHGASVEAKLTPSKRKNVKMTKPREQRTGTIVLLHSDLLHSFFPEDQVFKRPCQFMQNYATGSWNLKDNK